MKIKFNPFLKEVRGKIGNTVFRLCHTGEWQIAARPDMSKVKWSEAQKAHRKRFRYAVDYAKTCMKVPELRAYYLEMAHKRGTRRPFDEAVRHYFQGRDLILEGVLADMRREQQNCAASTGSEHPASDPAPKRSSQQENTAIQMPDSPQQAAPSTGPTTRDDGWTFTSLLKSDFRTGESDFYCVSTMYLVTVGNTAGLPAEILV
jgi:hypothetical protein